MKSLHRQHLFQSFLRGQKLQQPLRQERRSPLNRSHPGGVIDPREVVPQASQGGFTILELLVVMIIVGLLAAMAGPSWSRFVNGQRLGTMQDEVLRTLRKAQSEGRQQRRIWEACFRDRDGRLEYSTHPFGGVTGCGNARWRPLGAELDARVAIDTRNSTLLRQDEAYRMQFQPNGWSNGRLGRLTLVARDVPAQENSDRRCVFVSTLLGAFRIDRDRGCLR